MLSHRLLSFSAIAPSLLSCQQLNISLVINTCRVSRHRSIRLSSSVSAESSQWHNLAKHVLPNSWQIPQSICDHQTEHFGKERCTKCPLGGGCFEPRAAHQPVPLWIWLCIGATLAIPLYWVLHPHKARTWYYTSVKDEEYAAAWRRSWYEKIFREIGIEHPERLAVYETDALDHCTALGTNSDSGAYIFIPKMLIALTNPDTELLIPDEKGQIVFEGKVRDLTPEIRSEVLNRTGVLLPDSREISYVIGHEASHIYFNHAVKASGIGALSAGASHFLLKLFNRWTWARRHRQPETWLRPLASRWSHFLILLLSVIVSTVATSTYQERQADVHSAKQLHLKTSAIELTRKKQVQNKIEHAHGDVFKTATGNDLLDWEHPSIDKQIEYLSRIEE